MLFLWSTDEGFNKTVLSINDKMFYMNCEL